MDHWFIFLLEDLIEFLLETTVPMLIAKQNHRELPAVHLFIMYCVHPTYYHLDFFIHSYSLYSGKSAVSAGLLLSPMFSNFILKLTFCLTVVTTIKYYSSFIPRGFSLCITHFLFSPGNRFMVIHLLLNNTGDLAFDLFGILFYSIITLGFITNVSSGCPEIS